MAASSDAPDPRPEAGRDEAPGGADGLDVLDADAHGADPAEADVAPRSRRLGVVTLVLALVLLAVDGVAVGLLQAELVTAAASLALVTMLASIVVGVVALVAVALRRGRWPAVVAVLLCVLANPFVLVWLLGQVLPTS